MRCGENDSSRGKSAARERAAGHEADVRRARAQPVVSQADAPDAGELVDPLQVPARLARAVVAARRAERGAVEVVGQRALLALPEIFALQLEARGRAVAGRRPLEHAVQHVDVAVAGEGVDDVGAGAVDVLVRAVDALGAQVAQARAPVRALADVAADAGTEREAARAVAVALAAGERVATAELARQLEIGVGRRDPLQLHAVGAVLAAEERLVGQRGIDEVPGVGVLVVEVADRRQEASAGDREAVRQSRRAEVGLFHLGLVFGRDGEGQAPGEVGVDVRRERELRFAEAEAATARPELFAAGNEALDAVRLGVVAQVGVGTRQDGGQGEAGRGLGCGRRSGHGGRRCGCRGRCCCPGLRSFGSVESLLERLDASLVLFAQLLQLQSDFGGAVGLRKRRQVGRRSRGDKGDAHEHGISRLMKRHSALGASARRSVNERASAGRASVFAASGQRDRRGAPFREVLRVRDGHSSR